MDLGVLLFMRGRSFLKDLRFRGTLRNTNFTNVRIEEEGFRIWGFGGKVSPVCGRLFPFGGWIFPPCGRVSPLCGKVFLFCGWVSPFGGWNSPLGGRVFPLSGKVFPLRGRLFPNYGFLGFLNCSLLTCLYWADVPPNTLLMYFFTSDAHLTKPLLSSYRITSLEIRALLNGV